LGHGCFAGRLDGAYEPETALIERANEALFGAVIIDGAPRGADAGAQGRLRNETAFPHDLDQFVFGDDPLVIADKMNKQVEDLRLDRHAVSFSP